jgi:predicted acylesterase/phospholipase RssA/CRP-like cAMP-binding protein
MSTDDTVRRFGAVPPFDTLSPATLQEFAPDLRPLRLLTGEHLVTAGDTADEVFVIPEGELEILAPTEPSDGEVVLGRVRAGDTVGEIAVLAGGTRSATLRADGPVAAIGISAERFSELLVREPQVGTHLAAIASARLRATRFSGQLLRLFPGVTDVPVAELTDRVTFVSLAAGEVLFHEGEAADAAYVLVSGRVRILVRDDEGWGAPIAEVGAGELIGELALLDDGTRSATVVAARDSVLARLPRDDFESLVTSHPTAMLGVIRTIVARSRDTRDAFRRSRSDHSAVGLVPIGPHLDLSWLASELTARLQTTDRARLVTSDSLEQELGSPGIADARAGEPDELRLARWMEEAEATTDILVLQGDAVVSPWTRRCVSRVDHLVLIADATDHPQVTELERLLISARDLPHQRVSLVLLHPADTERPSGTAAWLDGRDVDEHHHVRMDRPADLDRLARHLAGRAVTLVFGGGGAKGFAHLGVVRAMRELGIPIDAVAGASMGAPLAAAVAADRPDDELVPTIARLYHKVLDYTVPVASMLSGRRIVRRIGEGGGDRDIEDLWLPFFCVSTNLTRPRVEVHRRGPLPLALRASASIPGVFPPVPYGEEDLLVDGGVLNNLPVDIARGLNPTGIVIASDVAPLLGPRAKSDYGLSVSGTSVLARRLTPGMKAPRVPALIATLMRSLVVAAAEQRDRGIAAGLADLHLQLDLRGVSLLDFEVCEPVADQGYAEAIGRLTEWLATAEVTPREIGAT